ncbi:MAG: OmpA family protein [Gammaproteobacteria bacterium]|nr:OmpA family protein [Gammaproteobacteria bacterium]
MNAMKVSRALCSVAVAAGLAAVTQAGTPERSGQASRQSDVGVVAGLIVGAAAGGPVGAIVGAAGGALLGDHVHRQQRRAAGLADELTHSERERTALQARVGELDGNLAQARVQAQQLQLAVQRTDQLALTVSFRTNEDAVSDAARASLDRLGGLALALPEAVVRVVGHADPRGTQEYNAALSLRRAEHVAAALSAGGLARERLIIQADGAECGEETAAGDLDSYALERRVDVQLELPQEAEVARRE